MKVKEEILFQGEYQDFQEYSMDCQLIKLLLQLKKYQIIIADSVEKI